MLKKLSTANIKQKEETTLKKTSQDSETAQQLFVQNENGANNSTLFVLLCV